MCVNLYDNDTTVKNNLVNKIKIRMATPVVDSSVVVDETWGGKEKPYPWTILGTPSGGVKVSACVCTLVLCR